MVESDFTVVRNQNLHHFVWLIGPWIASFARPKSANLDGVGSDGDDHGHVQIQHIPGLQKPEPKQSSIFLSIGNS
jgi:hypothetical protein